MCVGEGEPICQFSREEMFMFMQQICVSYQLSAGNTVSKVK